MAVDGGAENSLILYCKAGVSHNRDAEHENENRESCENFPIAGRHCFNVT